MDSSCRGREITAHPCCSRARSRAGSGMLPGTQHASHMHERGVAGTCTHLQPDQQCESGRQAKAVANRVVQDELGEPLHAANVGGEAAQASQGQAPQLVRQAGHPLQQTRWGGVALVCRCFSIRTVWAGCQPDSVWASHARQQHSHGGGGSGGIPTSGHGR